MKPLFSFLAIFVSISGIAQEDSTNAPEPAKKCNLQHEIGANATLLLKQVFNLSNNTFTTLPYNLTYKLIWKNMAFRTGAGFSANNLKVEETETMVTTGTSSSTVLPPNQKVPTVSKSQSVSYRAGIEYRNLITAKFAAYVGFDFVTNYSKSHSQSSSEFNNLPNSYQFSKTTNDVTLFTYGGGPVAGIQFYPTKRLGIFTEMPVYFVRGKQKDISESYTNVGNGFSGNLIYTTTTTKQTEETTLSGITIILPVTLYLSFTF